MTDNPKKRTGNFIQINDHLAIKSDSMQWMICKRSKPTTEWVSFAYYGSLAAVVKGLGDYMLRTGTADDANELRQLAVDIETLLSQKFTASFDISIRK